MTPVISPESGTFNQDTIEVTISSSEEGATIYYTTDGTDPTTSSTKYEESFEVPVGSTVKAIAVKEGVVDSEIATATYTKQQPQPSSDPKPSEPDKPSQACAGNQDKNCDGVVTCDEVNGLGWVWSESEKACVVDTVVVPSNTNTIYNFVNTSDR